jgi:tetratricopeptide (TPR) repeat protein
LNRQRSAVRIGIEAAVDLAIVTDLADLNHTKLVLQDGPTARLLRANTAFAELQGVLTIADQSEFRHLSYDVLLQTGSTGLDGAGNDAGHRESEIAVDSDPYTSERTAIEVLLANNQRGDARRRLEAFLPQVPDSAEAHNDLAVLRQMDNDLAGALEAIQRAATLSPNNAQVHRNLASIYLGIGSPLDALRAVDAAMRLQPNDGETMLVAGDVSLVLKREEDARLFYERAGSLSPHLRAAALARYRGLADSAPEALNVMVSRTR